MRMILRRRATGLASYKSPARNPIALRQRSRYLSSERDASDAQGTTNPAIDPRWLSDVKARIGKCIMFGLTPLQTEEAGHILRSISQDWRDLVAGAEGFLTESGRAGLYSQNIAWGDMVFRPSTLLLLNISTAW